VPQVNYGQAYYDNDDYDQGYQSYPQYSNYGYDDQSYGGGNSLIGGLLNNLPVGDLISDISGNSVAGELLNNFLSQGYDQGYQTAQYAQQQGIDTYYDPYAANDSDTYSVSMAENRRVFSEGYEQGYRDAMARRNEYDPTEDGQTPDLVSLLLGNVLSGV